MLRKEQSCAGRSYFYKTTSQKNNKISLSKNTSICLNFATNAQQTSTTKAQVTVQKRKQRQRPHKIVRSLAPLVTLFPILPGPLPGSPIRLLLTGSLLLVIAVQLPKLEETHFLFRT